MRWHFISNVVAAVLWSGVVALSSEEISNPAVDAIFADLTKPGSPGCALGIYRDGKIIYAKGYGLANVEENLPITTQSVFDIASVSKQFTAASILLLKRQGKLRLDDDIRKYVPELPNYSSRGRGRITILQLLNHTSGLRDYGNLFSLAGMDDDDVTTDEDALGIIVRQKALNFAPGSEWQYSNSGYLLLSSIVKRVSGKSLKEFAADNIFQPLGMAHTQYRDDHTFLIPHRVQAYSRTQNGGYRLNMSYAEETGDGMVHTTLEDLQKWDENFYSGKVGGKDFAAEMEENGKLNDGRVVEYAKGLRIWRYRGLPAVAHTGGSGGYRAYYIRFPEQHFSVSCFCNLEDVNRRKRVGAVIETYLGGLGERSEDEDAVVPGPTPQELGALVGAYQDAKSREVWRVAMRDNKLWVDFEGVPLELRALSQTDFEPVDYAFDLHMKFQRQSEKGTRRLIVKREMELPATLQAIEEARPSEAKLAPYVGDYWSDEVRATYRITVKAGKLRLQQVIGADGIVHRTLPFDELKPLQGDEFALTGAPIVFRFVRKTTVTGFVLNGFHERGILFVRKKTD